MIPSVRCRTLSGTVLIALLAPRAAVAHPGRAPEPHDLWSAWTLAPLVLVGTLGAAWLYGRGVRALWRRTGRARVVAPWRAWCYVGAILVILLALVSPVDAVSNALFSVHMLQHLLLMMVAAPLMLLGDPMTATLWAFPIGARRSIASWWRGSPAARRTWRIASTPAIAWMLHVLTVWLWHFPTFYDRAVADDGVHVLEHTLFFLTALLFWWPILKPHGRRLGAGVAILYLFGAALQSTILGAVLTLARHPLYFSHYATTRAWGLTPLEDQQLAGLLMWVPASLVYLVALLPLAIRLLGQPRDQRAGALAMAGVSARGTP